MNLKMPKKPIQCLNFVNNELIKPNGESYKVLSPYNNSIIGEYNSTLREEVDLAVHDANHAQK